MMMEMMMIGYFYMMKYSGSYQVLHSRCTSWLANSVVPVSIFTCLSAVWNNATPRASPSSTSLPLLPRPALFSSVLVFSLCSGFQQGIV